MLRVNLLTSSEKVPFDRLGDFEIGVSVYNPTSQTLHFDISETSLFINGNKSVAWDLAVQNGTIINFSVPSHQTKTVQWPLGKALFSEKGASELKLLWKGETQLKVVKVQD
ncbi:MULTISPECIES: NDR1/HIN1-like protein [unclassified Saccharicrinis]|uniref:NDR1/HIN1-like protein n=1 Tax=unclassified Saccharicrinis TaxID=2646859 RepID=UPI003D353083